MGMLGEKLAAEMKRQGIRPPELSRRTGVKVATIRRIVWGQVEDPGILTVAALAKELGRPIDYFLWDTGTDGSLAQVIGFFERQWPELDEKQREHIAIMLQMVDRERELHKILDSR